MAAPKANNTPANPGVTRATLVSAIGLALLWWVLTEGARAWWVGLPLVAVASYIGIRLSPARADTPRLRLHALPRFALFFLLQSLQAGFDVARRTLRVKPDIHPGTLHYSTTLPPGGARQFFATSVGLFPGTLCTDFSADDNLMIFHVLDTDVDIAADCRRLEREIERLFGLTPAVAKPSDTNNELGNNHADT